MGLLSIIDLKSNDNRMNGQYCSRNCIDERRASLPPFKDPKAFWRKDIEVAPKLEVPDTTTEPEVVAIQTQDGIDQGFNILFGNDPEDEEENPFSNLFG
jgi:hypothetical protein